MSYWKSYRYCELETLPTTPGVYVIYHAGRLVYAYSSENLLHSFKVIRSHRHLPPEVRATALIKVRSNFNRRSGLWVTKGRNLIIRLRPLLNREYVPEQDESRYTNDPEI